MSARRSIVGVPPNGGGPSAPAHKQTQPISEQPEEAKARADLENGEEQTEQDSENARL